MENTKEHSNNNTSFDVDAYLQQAEAQADILDVDVPSGVTYRFRKPNIFGALMAITESEIEASVNPQTNFDVLRSSFAIRDDLLEFSHTPKIVLEKTGAKNEILLQKIPESDLTFLFTWMTGFRGLMAKQILES